jgi:hypothetical protein
MRGHTILEDACHSSSVIHEHSLTFSIVRHRYGSTNSPQTVLVIPIPDVEFRQARMKSRFIETSSGLYLQIRRDDHWSSALIK